MNNEQILEIILSNYKTLVAYYSYPTGGNGTENVIAETDNFNGKLYNEPLKNIINLMVQLGAAIASCRNDNKTAVKVEVDGLDFPVYFYKYDGRFVITKSIDFSRSNEHKILWNVEL